MRELVRVEQPMRLSGLLPALVGTGVWGIALAVVLAVPMRDDRRWWVWVCAAGIALGLAAAAGLLVRRLRQPSGDASG